jgi:hypothetical protein
MISAKTADTLSLNDLTVLSQKSIADAKDALYESVKNFDRECFLIGTFDDDMEHYQTFTANKSIDDVNDCNLNMGNIFNVHVLKIKYETVQYIYREYEKKSRFFKNSSFLNRYFELIRGFPLYCDDSISSVNPGELVTVELMSEAEMNSYIEQLNYTPEQALHEYLDFIQHIKSEKQIYLQCIDEELTKGDSSKYAKKFITSYDFVPPWWSLLTGLSQLNYLNVFKKFILNDNEDALPKMDTVMRYLKMIDDKYDVRYYR